MNLQEALARAKSIPKVGDYEFIRRINGDGITHLCVVFAVSKDKEGTPIVDYVSRCGAEMGLEPHQYEVATGDECVNCIKCML